MAISGRSLAYVAGGFWLLYSGYANASLKDTATAFLAGKAPAKASTGAPTIGLADESGSSGSSGSGGSSGGSGSFAAAGSGSSASGQAALKKAAARYGWDSGAQWSALNSVEMAEAGYSATAKNPSSGALGIAQALGHGSSGTAGSLGNEYGGFGLTDAEAKQANSGNAYYQSVWMTNYIHAQYGTPEKAWAHEQSAHWY